MSCDHCPQRRYRGDPKLAPQARVEVDLDGRVMVAEAGDRQAVAVGRFQRRL